MIATDARALSRRRLLGATGTALAAALTTSGRGLASPAPGPTEIEDAGLPRWFPHQDPELVRRVVAVSHGDLEAVRELVSARPELAKSQWDWGFGDWESALGAAAHTGRRAIALYLIERGARPTLFSAAMLGQLEVVRAFITASPGVQRIPGPHGISLLAHAKAGGEDAQAVAAYLESVGDADATPATEPLDEDERRAYVGSYRATSGPTDRIEILERRGALMVARGDGTPRGLIHLGGHTFHPAGAPSVRIRFRLTEARAIEITFEDPDRPLVARRVDL